MKETLHIRYTIIILREEKLECLSLENEDTTDRKVHLIKTCLSVVKPLTQTTNYFELNKHKSTLLKNLNDRPVRLNYQRTNLWTSMISTNQ